MVIDDFDLGGSIIRPAEGDAPLFVDPNGVIACQITLKWFEAISRRHGQVLQNNCLIHLD